MQSVWLEEPILPAWMRVLVMVKVMMMRMMVILLWFDLLQWSRVVNRFKVLFHYLFLSRFPDYRCCCGWKKYQWWSIGILLFGLWIKRFKFLFSQNYKLSDYASWKDNGTGISFHFDVTKKVHNVLKLWKKVKSNQANWDFSPQKVCWL